MTRLSPELGTSGKFGAIFSDKASVGKSLLDGNKDHLLNQAKQEHQVGSLNG